MATQHIPSMRSIKSVLPWTTSTVRSTAAACVVNLNSNEMKWTHSRYFKAKEKEKNDARGAQPFYEWREKQNYSYYLSCFIYIFISFSFLSFCKSSETFLRHFGLVFNMEFIMCMKWNKDFFHRRSRTKEEERDHLAVSNLKWNALARVVDLVAGWLSKPVLNRKMPSSAKIILFFLIGGISIFSFGNSVRTRMMRTA